jgi:putative tryptophan/tyrosine transport system substrate-binding protein
MALVGALTLLALAAVAYALWPKPVRRVGFLGMDSTMQEARLVAFREGMRRHGYVEGENLAIVVRWAEGQFDRLPALASELVAQNVEVIVTAAPPPVRAAMKATSTIPIVMSVHDPVGMGFAASLARPGGNVTGVAFQDSELSTKRLDLLRSVVPNLTHVAILWNQAGGGRSSVEAVETAAASLKIATREFEISGPAEIPAAVAAAKAWGAQGLIQLASPVITLNRSVLLEALAANGMPATCELRIYVDEGCLMTYSADINAMFRELASIAVRILKGAKPAELALEQPREFDFVINLKTAEALGLAVPPIVQLQMTDRVR